MFNAQSPDTSDAGIERMIQAAKKTGPRITPADIENNIVGEYYFTAADGVSCAAGIVGSNIKGPLGLLTFCVLILKNGFTVTGESACASPENFDKGIGRAIARKNAADKIWSLMGYELRSKLNQEQA